MKTNFLPMAARLREMASQIDTEASIFDLTGKTCDCCQTFRYNVWQQKQMHSRVVGTAERLREIASTLERRNDDNEFNPPRS